MSVPTVVRIRLLIGRDITELAREPRLVTTLLVLPLLTAAMALLLPGFIGRHQQRKLTNVVPTIVVAPGSNAASAVRELPERRYRIRVTSASIDGQVAAKRADLGVIDGPGDQLRLLYLGTRAIVRGSRRPDSSSTSAP